MESQPQNPEFRNNPENYHPCICGVKCSIRKESFFEKSKLKLTTLTMLIYCYGIDLQVYECENLRLMLVIRR